VQLISHDGHDKSIWEIRGLHKHGDQLPGFSSRFCYVADPEKISTPFIGKLGDVIQTDYCRFGDADFPDDIKYQVGIRVTKEFAGWHAIDIAKEFLDTWPTFHPPKSSDGPWKRFPKPFGIYKRKDKSHSWGIDMMGGWP